MDAKQRVRAEAHARRGSVQDRPSKSEAIRRRVEALDEYRSAQIVSGYVGVKSEVETRGLLQDRFARLAPTAVVYREGPTLELCLIGSFEELEVGSFGLWEPRRELRLDPSRRCPADAVDLFLVPGLAFDLNGGRIGYGRGYYDSLLRRATPTAVTVGLAFQSQITDRVPMAQHDIPVHLVVTEIATYRVS